MEFMFYFYVLQILIIIIIVIFLNIYIKLIYKKNIIIYENIKEIKYLIRDFFEYKFNINKYFFLLLYYKYHNKYIFKDLLYFLEKYEYKFSKLEEIFEDLKHKYNIKLSENSKIIIISIIMDLEELDYDYKFSELEESMDKLFYFMKNNPDPIDKKYKDKNKRSSLSLIKAFHKKYCNIPPICGRKD